jgi:hypothetical protein
MGFLTSWFKSAKPLLQLHSGSFSMDRTGHILASTLPSSFPRHLLQTIGQCVTLTFKEAQGAQLPLEEIIVHYPGLKITAREMRGGAIVFISTPDQADRANSQNQLVL